MLSLHFFGAGRVQFDGQEMPGFPGQQASLLLCYLVLHRAQPLSRERLAAVFWADYPTATARKYLRNALWRLKQGLEALGADPDRLIQITEETIRFDPVDPFNLDLAAFDKSLQACKNTAPEALSDAQALDLEKAVSLYSGDLLNGIYEDWTLYERERLRLAYLNTLNKLMVYHGMHGNYAQGLVHGQRLLAIDATREKIHRQMMWLHWLAGDRNAALAQYKRCTQLLQTELGIPPMKATRNLYSRMKHNRLQNQAWPSLAGTQNKDQQDEDAAATGSLTRHALKRLHSLQQLADRINKELRMLEQTLNRTELDAD